MAKSPIIKRNSTTIECVLNNDDKLIELEGIGCINFNDFFNLVKEYDGELIKIQFSLIKK